MSDIDDLLANWDNFCDQLKASARLIARQEVPQSDRTSAEGIRYLVRLLRAATERSFECSDPDYPVFYSLSGPTIKIGSDNPDNVYSNAFIDPRLSYRLWGKVGNADLLAFSSKADAYAENGSMEPTGEISIADMVVDNDGTFELIASVDEAEGNWLPLSADSSMILVRETHTARANRQHASLHIEAISPQAVPKVMSRETVAKALSDSANFVLGTSALFADWMREFKQTPNDWTIVDQSYWRSIGGDANIFYLWGYWQLEEDEVLVITVTPPSCDYWNFQVNNYWDESLEYRYHQIHQNSNTVKYNQDGSVTVVLSHRDDVHPNYTVTTGLGHGAFMWRWVGASEFPIPQCRVVPISDIPHNY